MACEKLPHRSIIKFVARPRARLAAASFAEINAEIRFKCGREEKSFVLVLLQAAAKREKNRLDLAVLAVIAARRWANFAHLSSSFFARKQACCTNGETTFIVSPQWRYTAYVQWEASAHIS